MSEQGDNTDNTTSNDVTQEQLEDIMEQKRIIETQLAALTTKIEMLQQFSQSAGESSTSESSTDTADLVKEVSETPIIQELSMLKLTPLQQGQIDDPNKDEASKKIVETPEANPHQDEVKSQSITPQRQEETLSRDAQRLIDEIRSMPPPVLKLTKPVRVIEEELRAENIKRRRFLNLSHAPKLTADGEVEKSIDIPGAMIAPSVTVKPLPIGDEPNFKTILEELNIPELVNSGGTEPLYFVDCRIVTEKMFKDILLKRAEILVTRMEGKKVDRGTQTYVTQVGKQYVAGCVNCRSSEHRLDQCKLDYRPGFCWRCGADNFDSCDCVYPHGVEHERSQEKCVGCGRDLTLYCPECPDCNIRWEGLVDWLRLNYATWPVWMVPNDHRYLVDKNCEMLRKKIKARFNDPQDTANKVKNFLVRENALALAPPAVNPLAENVLTLSEEKRRLAVNALSAPYANKALDEIMRERPELKDCEKIVVIVPTKYQKGSKK